MRIIFCIPGKQFSDNWLRSWIDTTSMLNNLNISWSISMAYDPVVYYARNRVLGGNNILGRRQIPWNGHRSYDKMIWIDSDMVWTSKDVVALINHSEPIVAGTYLTADNNTYPIVENLDYSHLSSNGTFKFMSRDDMSNKTSLFTASYTGFGFVGINSGVIETMEYPWFKPRWVENNNFYDFCAEDVGFCWTAQDLGYTIRIDPSIKVGHEKLMIL